MIVGHMVVFKRPACPTSVLGQLLLHTQCVCIMHLPTKTASALQRCWTQQPGVGNSHWKSYWVPLWN